MMNVDAESHFAQMMTWLAMESEAEIAQMAERRKRMMHRDPEESGETLVDMVIVDEEPGLGGRTLATFERRKQSVPLPRHRIRVGSPVVVSGFPDDHGRSEQGVVSRRTSAGVQISLNHSPEGSAFRIDLTADEVTRQRQLAAISTALQSRGRLGKLRDILMGVSEPTFRAELPEVHFVSQLNDSQQRAVEFALSANDLAIIHGPPGTGKTTTVVELIIQSVKRGERVLAVAPSNTATDNLLARLIDAGQKVVRIGHPARVSETLRSHTLDGLAQEHESMDVINDLYSEAESLFRQAGKWTRHRPARGEKQDMRREAKELQKHARMLERQAVDAILATADVICATTTFNEDLIRDLEFQLVVIDEACQATEPGAWVPILRADKIVLSGDHQQLPPTVLSRPAANEGFAISLLERQIKVHGDEIACMLTTQYRMHEKIMQFSSQHFYGGNLIADDSVAGHLLTDAEGVQENERTTTPVEFIDTAGAGWDEAMEAEGTSRLNPQEAHFVVRIVRQLMEQGVAAGGIAIIAPYAAQVRYFRDQLESLPQGDGTNCANRANGVVEVDTVDGFQGREKEAIIISTVRSNETGEIGFLADERRMNVAMTRAKRKLIVVGDSATLGGNAFFSQLLEHFQNHASYRSVFQEADI